jgi:hypothetical protein
MFGTFGSDEIVLVEYKIVLGEPKIVFSVEYTE